MRGSGEKNEKKIYKWKNHGKIMEYNKIVSKRFCVCSQKWKWDTYRYLHPIRLCSFAHLLTCVHGYHGYYKSRTTQNMHTSNTSLYSMLHIILNISFFFSPFLSHFTLHYIIQNYSLFYFSANPKVIAFG